MNQSDRVRFIESRHDMTILGALGIRIDSYDAPNVVVALDVDHRHFQTMGLVHGGVYVVMIETAASVAASLMVDVTKFAVSGMEVNANHIKAVTSGSLKTSSELLHRGRRSMVFGVKVLNQDGALVSVGRCTIAITAIGP